MYLNTEQVDSDLLYRVSNTQNKATPPNYKSKSPIIATVYSDHATPTLKENVFLTFAENEIQNVISVIDCDENCSNGMSMEPMVIGATNSDYVAANKDQLCLPVVQPGQQCDSERGKACQLGKHTRLDPTDPILEVNSTELAGCDITNGIENLDHDLVYDVSRGFDRYNKYAPIIFHHGVGWYKDRSYVHQIGGINTSWNIPAWEFELGMENDIPLRMYIDHSIRHGVLIVDQCADIPTYLCQNYLSATSEPAFSFLDELIHQELTKNRLILSDSQPHCVHALGAVPKKGGGWRPITDCRRPLGLSINNYMVSTFKEFSFRTVDDVCALVTTGCYMATVDIEAAYRTVTISPEHWKYQGLQWRINGRNSYLLDTSLCFGLKCAPYVFNQFSNFVTRCMNRRGFTSIINYLDDYWIKGDSFMECQTAQMALIELLGSLGFVVSFKKCSSPATRVVYLGIEFDSTEMSISLPGTKMESLIQELRFFHKSRATIKQLQRICGIVAHASKVVKGGCTFSRRMLDTLKGLPQSKKRVRLSKEFREDLLWWESILLYFNGTAIMIPHNNGEGKSFITDASKKRIRLCLSRYMESWLLQLIFAPGGFRWIMPVSWTLGKCEYQHA